MNFFRRFMAGRYGSDQLNNALLLLGVALILIEWITGWNWMGVFILALLILCYFRIFSRNIQARYAENQKFLRWWGPVSVKLRNARMRFADRKRTAISNAPSASKGSVFRAEKGRSASPARTAARSLSEKRKPLELSCNKEVKWTCIFPEKTYNKIINTTRGRFQ